MEAVDPGPWMEKILPTFTVSSQKKTCALCELWFSVENLTGMCSYKGVLSKKASFGDKHAEKKLRDPRMTASRLYSGVKLCTFCAQLVLPDEEELGSTRKSTPGKKGKAKDIKAGAGEEGHRPSDFLKSFLSPEARKKYEPVDAHIGADLESAEQTPAREP
jgi:hypothetical protein